MYRFLALAILMAEGLLLSSCDSSEVVTPDSASLPATEMPVPAPPAAGEHPVLVGAGDIAECGNRGAAITAALLDAIPGTVFTTGDNAYDSGSSREFARCYEPAWGRHRWRTRPTPGNHDYETKGAAGYFGYFGAAAGDPARGYYSYDLGEWHIIALNSNCKAIGGCGAGSPQEQWLRADLAAHPSRCTLAYWHHPHFSSGRYRGDASLRALWQALYEHGAEIIINGHERLYERFAPQTPDGEPNPERGIRQFTAGTGGRGHHPFKSVLPASEVRQNSAHGVLMLTLRPDGYDWAFVPEAGSRFRDNGADTCH